MKKYTLFTWPDSQEFVSNPNCVLVCPPEDETDPTRLDSSYMVPVEIADPAGAEKIYVQLDIVESQNWIGKEDDEDNVLFDYDGCAFVEESLFKKTIEKGQQKVALLVGFTPMTRVVVSVPENIDAEAVINEQKVYEAVIDIAREHMRKDLGSYLYGDNCDRYEIDAECPAREDEDAELRIGKNTVGDKPQTTASSSLCLNDMQLEVLSSIFHEYKDYNRNCRGFVSRAMELEKILVAATGGKYQPDTTYDVKD